MRLSRRMGLLHSGPSGLTNTTWVFNSTITLKSSGTAYAIDFTSNGSTFSSIGFFAFGAMKMLTYNNTYVYSGDSGWTANQGYKTITITGGTDITNADFISWLQDNATQTA